MKLWNLSEGSKSKFCFSLYTIQTGKFLPGTGDDCDFSSSCRVGIWENVHTRIVEGETLVLGQQVGYYEN